MDRYLELGMPIQVGSYVATATLAGRSGGGEEEQEAMASLFSVEALGQRLETFAKIVRARRRLGRSGSSCKQTYREERR